MHAEIPVSEIMVRDVVTAPTSATATDAADRMRERGVSSIVVMRDGSPVGIVTEGDFATCLCERPDLGHLELGEIMSTPLRTIGPDTSILEAVSVFRETGVEHVPVVTDGHATAGPRVDVDESDADGTALELVGIVTTTEMTYFVPQVIHARPHTPGDRPLLDVRTDTAYERDDWHFEYHGEDETTVSVGDVARFSKPVTAEDVESFAAVTGDTNRVHLDTAYAAETRFGQPIVHGALAVGLVSAALARLPGLTIYLSQENSFVAPLPVGGRATARCEVLEDLGGAKYRIETAVLDDEDEPVLDGESVVLIDEIPLASQDTPIADDRHGQSAQ